MSGLNKDTAYGQPTPVHAAPLNTYPPIHGQPINNQPTTYVVGTVAAPPVVVQSTPHYSNYPNNSGYPGQPGMNPLYPANGRARPSNGRWADSICDWPSNLFPSCYCVCCVCCGMYLVAQMAEKTGHSSFRNVLLAFCIVCVVGFIVQLIIGGSWIVWIPAIFASCYAMSLRIHIANRDQITECGQQPCLGECCVGFWCFYCSIAQMARHVYGYTKVYDGDSDPFRPDQYSPVSQV